MANRIAGKNYECPRGLDAKAISFLVVQASRRACEGNLLYREDCKACVNYLPNAQAEEWERDNKPISTKYQSR
jgi:hypothetical protein